jgi:hypothetical protein
MRITIVLVDVAIRTSSSIAAAAAALQLAAALLLAALCSRPSQSEHAGMNVVTREGRNVRRVELHHHRALFIDWVVP